MERRQPWDRQFGQLLAAPLVGEGLLELALVSSMRRVPTRSTPAPLPPLGSRDKGPFVTKERPVEGGTSVMLQTERWGMRVRA